MVRPGKIYQGLTPACSRSILGVDTWNKASTNRGVERIELQLKKKEAKLATFWQKLPLNYPETAHNCPNLDSITPQSYTVAP